MTMKSFTFGNKIEIACQVVDRIGRQYNAKVGRYVFLPNI